MLKKLLFAGLATLAFLPGRAQTTTISSTAPTAPATVTSSNAAVDLAEGSVDKSIGNNLVSVYGVGTPAAIQTWWVIFYDPSVPSHGRVVRVDHGVVTRTYAADGGVVYADALTLMRSQVSDAGSALATAQTYAGQHALAYDNVRVLLRGAAKDPNLVWRVQLLNGAESKGFVFVNATDGAFASYSPPGAVHAQSSTSTGGVEADARRAGNDVKNTFLGIGGDLQQFFTGERTVDQ